jgi:hypothetical protein
MIGLGALCGRELMMGVHTAAVREPPDSMTVRAGSGTSVGVLYCCTHALIVAVSVPFLTRLCTAQLKLEGVVWVGTANRCPCVVPASRVDELYRGWQRRGQHSSPAHRIGACIMTCASFP